MDIKLFTDLIDALGKVGGVIKEIAKLPQGERDRFRKVFGETYLLLNTTLTMVIIRLGDMLFKERDGDFVDEVKRLDNFNEWHQAEREFRLCESLRVTLADADHLPAKVLGKTSTRDWKALLECMHAVLAGENTAANYITDKFRELADYARATLPTPEAVNSLRQQVQALRNGLLEERRRLIKQEQDILSSFV